jgi:hypothetical protein
MKERGPVNSKNGYIMYGRDIHRVDMTLCNKSFLSTTAGLARNGLIKKCK